MSLSGSSQDKATVRGPRVDELVPHADSANVGGNHPSALQTQNNSDLASLLRTTVEAVSDDDGWARLSKVGPLLTRNTPTLTLIPMDTINSVISPLPRLS
jgi:hypothetical protein